MLKSVFKRLKGDKRSSDEQVAIDLTRAIPGYAPPPDRTLPESQAMPEESTDLQPAQSESEVETTTRDVLKNVTEPVSSLEDKAEAAVASMSDKHDTWAQTDLNSLSEAWNSAKNNPDLTDHLKDVERNAHNLKGMATTYGHPSIARLASSLCKLLESDLAGHQHALINLHIEACRAAYLEGNSTDGGDEVAQSVCVALETQVNRTLQA